MMPATVSRFRPLFTTSRPQPSHVVLVARDMASRQKDRAVSPQLVHSAGTIVVSESRGGVSHVAV